MPKFVFAAFAAAASVAFASAASASVVLDQATVPGTGHIDFAGGSGDEFGTGGIIQTFTVGVTGVLDHVGLDVESWTFLGSPGPVHFEVVKSDFSTLFSHDIAAADVPAFGFSGFDWANVLNIDVSSAAIHVTSGDVLGLKVASPAGDATSLVWRSAFGGVSINYAGGQAYGFDVPPGFPGPALLGNDFGFRTYVDAPPAGPAAAPEPAGWALMILGFGLAGGSVRLARRRAAGLA